jgi:hypothetical protein
VRHTHLLFANWTACCSYGPLTLLWGNRVLLDWAGVFDRIKGLVNVSDQAQQQTTATLLGVDERHLRAAINNESRLSTLKFVGAVVRVYGLDPTWILTGNYDGATHRIALHGDSAAIDDLLSRIATKPSRPSAPDQTSLELR